MVAKVFQVVTKELLGCWSGYYVVPMDLKVKSLKQHFCVVATVFWVVSMELLWCSGLSLTSHNKEP